MSAPERIYADRGPKGGWMYRDKKMPDTEYTYLRADIAASQLAEALENVERYVAVAREEKSRAEAAEAERDHLAADKAQLTQVVEFVARWAWRTDPPNANNELIDAERLSVIKYHPTIKAYGAPHRELADSESIRAIEVKRHD